MATVSLKFRASKVKGKAGVLYFQIAHHQISRQFTTAYRIFPDEWDVVSSSIIIPQPQDLRYSYLRSTKLGVEFDTQRLQQIVHSLLLDGVAFSADDVIAQFTRVSTCLTLLTFTHALIKKFKQLGRERIVETYTATMHSVMRFRGGVDTPLDMIDADWVQSYETYLKSIGLTPNTTSFYMRILRAIYNRAVTQGIIEQRYPFKHVYTGIGKTIKRAIDIKYIKELKSLDLSATPSLELTRDIFLFSFYTRGMSFVDMAFLRKSNLRGDVLVYRRRKTQQQLQIKWEDCMQEIVNRYDTKQSPYLLPIITSSSTPERDQYRSALILYNRRLKKIGNMLGVIAPLTMYVARHSWASAAKRTNIPISVISQAMGHESEATTQIYLASLDSSTIDKANSLILGLL